jgi:hypothetical protein
MDTVRAAIVEEFVNACHDTFPRYNLHHRRDYVNAANAFIARNPHILERWPE